MKIMRTFPIVTTSLRIWIVLIYFSCAWSQDYNFTGLWTNVGPNDNPEARSQSAAGLGPVEFIRISKNNPELMLGGSLKGGLFVSENGGNNWQNAGSDSWQSSKCGWAEFHPENDNIWFAIAMQSTYNGSPSSIGKIGGVFRTKNKGDTWESVANYSDFKNDLRTTIFGIRFHPTNKNKMYLLTTKGIYFTENCMADYLEWTKVKYVSGKIYDLEVNEEYLCFSQEKKGIWNVMISEGQKLVPIPEITKESSPISNITIEKYQKEFYILIDFKDKKDEVRLYKPKTKTLTTVFNAGKAVFGAGYTFGINPHNGNELWIGNGLRIRKWLIDEQRYGSFGNKYHVDVECVEFHPTLANVVYIGTHGGVFKTVDNGEAWEFKSKGFGNAEVYGLSVSSQDHQMIAVGLNHGGSLVRADWKDNGTYYWKQVNGGDALLPIINPSADSIIYTSNQYTGGGLYYSTDSAKRNKLIHSRRQFLTSGWSMAVKLHPVKDSILFFNFKRNSGINKGCIDVVRSKRPHERDSIEVISNFHQTHQLSKYEVYGLYVSEFHPDALFAYVISDEKIETKTKKIHRLYMIQNSLVSADSIINQWQELELPRSSWIGDLEVHPKRLNKLYVSYAAGLKVKSSAPDDKGMVFHLKYKKSNYSLVRNWDISASIPSATGGKNNMIVTKEKGMFIGTSTGVYYGSKSTLRGGKSWEKIGVNSPHCKVMGLDYKPNGILTVAYDGRGVWQLNVTPEVK
ncbi:MAG: WD40/YVTN/BNR-like repeat-containing protein [Crocinitomicaceae bacterium]